MDKDHLWHMAEAGRLAEPGDRIVVSTAHRLVDLADPASTEAATRWWSDLTAGGGEGMVVKPRDFVAQGRKGLAQPAVKCRGPEYLRIIYGPEYDAPEHLARLRSRGLGRKRSLAMASFSSGRRRCGGSLPANHCAAFMKQSSRCWRWRASQWIRGCNGALVAIEATGLQLACSACALFCRKVAE